MPAGKLWKFDAVINAGTASLDNFIERNEAATTTAYVSGLFEYQNGATTKYYDGGAMRRTGYPADNGISYVLGDQLGSTSVIAGQNGTALATKRFTGQCPQNGNFNLTRTRVQYMLMATKSEQGTAFLIMYSLARQSQIPLAKPKVPLSTLVKAS